MSSHLGKTIDKRAFVVYSVSNGCLNNDKTFLVVGWVALGNWTVLVHWLSSTQLVFQMKLAKGNLPNNVIRRSVL